MKMLVADPDNTEDVVFDFAGNDGKATGNTFDVSGDYWYVEGIKFLNGGGVRVGGNHNILKNCDFAGHQVFQFQELMVLQNRKTGLHTTRL